MTKGFRPDVDAPAWKGGHTPYDIVKEGAIALLVVAILTLLLAIVFGSPDEPAITLKSWSNAAPVDFAQDALSQLNGTSETATYGPPYNSAAVGQELGPFSLAKWVGVTMPINTADVFVIDPLKSQPHQPVLSRALTTWASASVSTRSTWVANYTKGAAHMTFSDDHVLVNATDAGPVGVFINDVTLLARSGAMDEALGNESGFFNTNYTLPLLFLEDGTYLATQAAKQHLSGDQWGMMNETGNYPGQAWLWLYTFWYQIPPFNSSGNGDILVWAVMMLLSALLLLVPFVPGLRSIPRKTRIYRLIWREHYQSVARE
ncbi:MAG TPA: hypothetical protein VGP11_05865 [Acidimicrobiales bacterium]|jgi:hypothetical protein|nr:hypothetical protein [Acidimicrobiales bacterium]